MKKFILLMTLLIVTLSAKPCMTDIYFGNGVWNDRRDAIDNMDALKKFMLYQANIRLDPNKETVDYQFKYAHNPSYGTIDDIIETFWQLKESGQISKYYFESISNALAMKKGNLTSDEIWETIHNIVSQYNEDVVTMLHLYQESSFNQKHNVLLVAHSQGNLWGNKMYTLFTDEQKKKFRMVSVATPANHVMVPGKTDPYVTASEDYVIGPIPGALPGNVDGIGHAFVGAYLAGSINAPRKIALYVKTAYDELLKSSICGGYDRIYMHMYGVDYIKVYGTPSGTYAIEEIGTVPLEPYAPPIKVVVPDYPEDRVFYICSDPQYIYGDPDLFSGDSSNGYLSWKLGTIYSKEMLESRKGISYTITSATGGSCADVSMSGELYDLALSAFE